MFFRESMHSAFRCSLFRCERDIFKFRRNSACEIWWYDVHPQFGGLDQFSFRFGEGRPGDAREAFSRSRLDAVNAPERLPGAPGEAPEREKRGKRRKMDAATTLNSDQA